MEFRFADDGLREVDTYQRAVLAAGGQASAVAEPPRSTGRGKAIDQKFSERMTLIRSATDEREFYNLKSLHFEKLKGKREGDYSMKLNDQWRLIVRFEGEAPRKVVVVVGIEDYH